MARYRRFRRGFRRGRGRRGLPMAFFAGLAVALTGVGQNYVSPTVHTAATALAVAPIRMPRGFGMLKSGCQGYILGTAIKSWAVPMITATTSTVNDAFVT